MNVVLDNAEEVWIKDTKSRKAGDRATLGALSLSSLLLPPFLVEEQH
jgi:small nuclear ribonucleoprotein (snRNP)-like protein